MDYNFDEFEIGEDKKTVKITLEKKFCYRTGLESIGHYKIHSCDASEINDLLSEGQEKIIYELKETKGKDNILEFTYQPPDEDKHINEKACCLVEITSTPSGIEKKELFEFLGGDVQVEYSGCTGLGFLRKVKNFSIIFSEDQTRNTRYTLQDKGLRFLGVYSTKIKIFEPLNREPCYKTTFSCKFGKTKGKFYKVNGVTKRKDVNYGGEFYDLFLE